MPLRSPALAAAAVSVLGSPLAVGGMCLLAVAGITAGVTSVNAGQEHPGGRHGRGQAGTAGGGGTALTQSAAAAGGDGQPERRLGLDRDGLDDGRAGQRQTAPRPRSPSPARRVRLQSATSNAQPTGGYQVQPVIGGPPTTLANGAATVAALPTPPPRTSCTSVVHIGDSTSDGLFSNDYLPDKAQQIPAQYADVGVKTTNDKVVGATSVVESLPGTPNAPDDGERRCSRAATTAAG